MRLCMMWWIMPIDENERLEDSLQDLHTHFYSFLTHESPIQQLLYYLKFKIMICWVNKLMHALVYFLQNIGSFLCKVSCWFPQKYIISKRQLLSITVCFAYSCILPFSLGQKFSYFVFSHECYFFQLETRLIMTWGYLANLHVPSNWWYLGIFQLMHPLFIIRLGYKSAYWSPRVE